MILAFLHQPCREIRNGRREYNEESAEVAYRINVYKTKYKKPAPSVLDRDNIISNH